MLRRLRLVRWPGCSQANTYLLHFVERGLVDAHLLEVILRGLNHLVDDLTVDLTLESPSAGCLHPALPRGLLTTISFDMVARSPKLRLSSARLQRSRSQGRRWGRDCRLRAEGG
jgi:hypothetical protein